MVMPKSASCIIPRGLLTIELYYGVDGGAHRDGCVRGVDLSWVDEAPQTPYASPWSPDVAQVIRDPPPSRLCKGNL